MERSTSGNGPPAAYIGPPERPTQTVGHVGVSMGGLGVAALLQNVTDFEANVLEAEGTREEYTTRSLVNIGELATRRQQRMDW